MPGLCVLRYKPRDSRMLVKHATTGLYSQPLAEHFQEYSLKKKKLFTGPPGGGWREQAQQLRHLRLLQQDPGLVLRTWGPGGCYPYFQLQRIQRHLLTSEESRHTCGTHTHMQPKHFYTENKLGLQIFNCLRTFTCVYVKNNTLFCLCFYFPHIR